MAVVKEGGQHDDENILQPRQLCTSPCMETHQGTPPELYLLAPDMGSTLKFTNL